MEVTYSVTPTVAVNTTKPNNISVQADQKCNVILYGTLNIQKVQRNITELSKTLLILSPLSHMLTVKLLQKVFMTSSVWGNIRNLLNDHVLY